ncbi:MAG: hypothetical protein IGR76_05720 [Synechococcales cyanobacterium T60_A2020_003]|nr:hypothetical protein [Synechococcales cyanobacterium T60_A2020_003]
MTTPVLMSPSSVIAKPALSVVPSSEAASVTIPNSFNPKTPPIADRLIAPSSCPIRVTDSTPRLPYRPKHQAELLCLQAEVDALLNQLLTIQKEKRVASGSR